MILLQRGFNTGLENPPPVTSIRGSGGLSRDLARSEFPESFHLEAYSLPSFSRSGAYLFWADKKAWIDLVLSIHSDRVFESASKVSPAISFNTPGLVSFLRKQKPHRYRTTISLTKPRRCVLKLSPTSYIQRADQLVLSGDQTS